MTDHNLRELERRWKESGAVEDEAALLHARVQAGDLEEEKLFLLYFLHHPAAIIVMGQTPAKVNTIEQLVNIFTTCDAGSVEGGLRSCLYPLLNHSYELGDWAIVRGAKDGLDELIEFILETPKFTDLDILEQRTREALNRLKEQADRMRFEYPHKTIEELFFELAAEVLIPWVFGDPSVLTQKHAETTLKAKKYLER